MNIKFCCLRPQNLIFSLILYGSSTLPCFAGGNSLNNDVTYEFLGCNWVLNPVYKQHLNNKGYFVSDDFSFRTIQFSKEEADITDFSIAMKNVYPDVVLRFSVSGLYELAEAKDKPQGFHAYAINSEQGMITLFGVGEHEFYDFVGKCIDIKTISWE